MASINSSVLCFIALCIVFDVSSPPKIAAQIGTMYPFSCTNAIPKCNALLYQHNHLTLGEIVDYYSVNTLQIRSIARNRTLDFLVSVPCSCQDLNSTTGYFYDTNYKVQPNDTFFNVTNNIYSGQAWNNNQGAQNLIPGENISVDLLCGCFESGVSTDEGVITYTVQVGDTLFSIAKLLSSEVQDIKRLNINLATGANLLEVGWVLYVPTKNLVNIGF